MGLYASAELIWGIPVEAYDEDGNPTPFWDEDAADWREFEGEIEVYHYGHYDDPDGPRGILTSTRVKQYRGDCWDPTAISVTDLVTAEAFDESAGWWLVASYG